MSFLREILRSSWAVGKGVQHFSSNYVLYGDMSRRLYEVLQRFAPRVEPYSITQYQGENSAYYLEHQHDPDVIAKFKSLSDQQTLDLPPAKSASWNWSSLVI